MFVFEAPLKEKLRRELNIACMLYKWQFPTKQFLMKKEKSQEYVWEWHGRSKQRLCFWSFSFHFWSSESFIVLVQQHISNIIFDSCFGKASRQEIWIKRVERYKTLIAVDVKILKITKKYFLKPSAFPAWLFWKYCSKLFSNAMFRFLWTRPPRRVF